MCSKSRQTRQNPGEEISIQMCCLRLHEEKIQSHTEKECETWQAMSVHGAPPFIIKTARVLTVRPKTATDSQDAHACNRGGPCQNRGGSLQEPRELSVRTAGSSLLQPQGISVGTAGGTLFEPREALCENRKKVFVRTEGGSLLERREALC